MKPTKIYYTKNYNVNMNKECIFTHVTLEYCNFKRLNEFYLSISIASSVITAAERLLGEMIMRAI